MLKSCSNKLEIQPSTFGGFGMFANCDIKKHDTILDAPSPAGTSNKPSVGKYCYNCAALLKPRTFQFNCCTNMTFCSEECKTIAAENYHTALCGRDFSDIYELASSKTFAISTAARETLVFQRLLAMRVQAGTPPLRTPPISWITANYQSRSPLPWNRGTNIIGPINVLQKLGVNIFTAEEYDTWVLQDML